MEIIPAELCRMVGVIRAHGLISKDESKFHDVLQLQHSATIPEFDEILQEWARENGERLVRLIGSLGSPPHIYEKLFLVEKVNSFAGPFGIDAEPGMSEADM
jgi:hypothetical protein